MTRFRHHEVEGLRVGRFGSQINTTCILYRLGGTLVDTGPPNQWRRVRRFLEERAVERVLVTHHHEDHAGNLAAIGGDLGAAVLAPALALAPLAAGFPLEPYQRIIWGRPATVRAEPLPERIDLGGAGSLVPIAAPGHSVDMTCFLEPDRGWLFSGDLYISGRTRYLRRDEDLPAHLRSLEQALALHFDTLLCSHRGVVPDGKKALRAKLDFLLSLRERARELRRQGRGVAEITRILVGREDLMTWITGYHFSKRNLIRGCLAEDRGDRGQVIHF